MEDTNRERLQRLGNDILTVSKNELLVSMRFLELAFPMLTNRMNMSTFLIATDGESLFYQPRFLSERYQLDRILVNRAYLHLLFHCLFGHVFRERDLEGNELEESLWHLSCDMVCEYLIDHMEFSSIQWIEDERKMAWYDKLEHVLPIISADGVYDYLNKNDKEIEDIDRLSLLFLVDDHCFWNQKKRKKGAYEEEKKKEQENRWGELSEKIETGLETYYRAQGNKTGTLMKFLRIKNRKKQDYGTFLHKFATINEEIKEDFDSFDYGFYLYGMNLYGNMPLIEELEYKEEYRIREFVIAIDTSGSCSFETITRFIETTFDLLTSQNLFGNKMDIYLIQCDNEVKDILHLTSKEQIIQQMQQFEVKGHGGTDFRPVFSYVANLQKQKILKNLKGLLYFTDGYGIYPKQKTEYKTAFIFPSGDYQEMEVPPWAMKLIL